MSAPEICRACGVTMREPIGRWDDPLNAPWEQGGHICRRCHEEFKSYYRDTEQLLPEPQREH